MRRARVLVCNDAGARHVAVALGVPSVVLFGPTSLAKTNLNLERVRALAADVACRPCYHRACPIDHRCMTRLAPERVAAAALPALRGALRGDGALRALRRGAERVVTDLSIVLLTWNGRDLALDCLASIEREIRARSDAGRLETETIVVDNGSADGTRRGGARALPVGGGRRAAAQHRLRGRQQRRARARQGPPCCACSTTTPIVQRGRLRGLRALSSTRTRTSARSARSCCIPDGRKQNSIHNFPTLLLEIVPRGVLETLFPRRYPVEALRARRAARRRGGARRLHGGAPRGARAGRPDARGLLLLPRGDGLVLRDARRRAGAWCTCPTRSSCTSTARRPRRWCRCPTRIEYHRSLYHFFRKNRGAGAGARGDGACGS